MPITTIAEHNPDVVELPSAFTEPHEATHPGQINFADFGDNPALKRASDALKFWYDGAIELNSFRQNPDDEVRAATHDRLTRERVDKFETNYCAQFENAKADLKRELANVETNLEYDAGLKPNDVHFNAVTAAFSYMKPEQRLQTLNDLIEQGENAALATLIEAPLFLTGLTAEQRSGIKERVFNKVDPKRLALRNQLKVAFSKMENASIPALRMTGNLRAGTEPGAWRERAKKAAIAVAVNNATNRSANR